jgi:hypothetical protein
MLGAIGALITLGVAAVGYVQARVFTRRRLQFVDSAQSGVAPVIAGVAAAVVGTIILLFVPFFGAGTALLFGAGVGAGVASGQSDIRHRRLTP